MKPKGCKEDWVADNWMGITVCLANIYFPNNFYHAIGLSGVFHKSDKLVKQAFHIMRPGAGLWMALEAERRHVSAADAL